MKNHQQWGLWGYIWVNFITAEPCSPWNHGLDIGKSSPFMAELVRLVNYYNLPRSHVTDYSGSFRLPSGKHTKSYGKSPCLMGKSTISMAIFNSKLLVDQRVMILTFLLTHILGPRI